MLQSFLSVLEFVQVNLRFFDWVLRSLLLFFGLSRAILHLDGSLSFSADSNSLTAEHRNNILVGNIFSSGRKCSSFRQIVIKTLMAFLRFLWLCFTLNRRVHNLIGMNVARAVSLWYSVGLLLSQLPYSAEYLVDAVLNRVCWVPHVMNHHIQEYSIGIKLAFKDLLFPNQGRLLQGNWFQTVSKHNSVLHSRKLKNRRQSQILERWWLWESGLRSVLILVYLHHRFQKRITRILSAAALINLGTKVLHRLGAAWEFARSEIHSNLQVCEILLTLFIIDSLVNPTQRDCDLSSATHYSFTLTFSFIVQLLWFILGVNFLEDLLHLTLVCLWQFFTNCYLPAPDVFWAFLKISISEFIYWVALLTRPLHSYYFVDQIREGRLLRYAGLSFEWVMHFLFRARAHTS